MSVLRNIMDGLRSLFRKEQVCQDLDEELDGFLEMAVEEKMRHGRISALLCGGPHHPRHSFGHLLPFRLFDHELLSAFLRSPVVLELPVAVGCHLPLGRAPSSLQPMHI